MVVIDPYQIWQNNFGGCSFPNGLAMLNSTYFPYESPAKYALGRNMPWAREAGVRFYSDFDLYGEGGRVVPRSKYGLHASGHVSFEQMVDQVLVPLIAGRWRETEIILLHGENPVDYAQAFKKKVGLDRGQLNIRSNLDRYDPTKPLSRPGFRLPLE